MLLQIYLLDYTMKHLLLLHSEFIFPIAPELYELLLLDLRQYSDFFFLLIWKYAGNQRQNLRYSLL